jgi:hypothetical protein
MKLHRIVVVLSAMLTVIGVSQAIEYPHSTEPGKAAAQVDNDDIVLANSVLRLGLTQRSGNLRPTGLVNVATGENLSDVNVESEFFLIAVGQGGKTYRCSQLTVRSGYEVSKIEAEPASRTAAKRFSGIRVTSELVSPDGVLAVEWSLELRDGSNYVRQFLTIRPQAGPVQITSVQFWDVNIDNGRVAGTVLGSPIVAGDCFVAYEHPNAENRVDDPSAAVNLAYRKSATASGVFGVMAPKIAVDGNFDVNSYWGCQNTPVWLRVDLGKPADVSKIRLVTWYNNQRYYGYKIESSIDSRDWHTLVDAADNKAAATNAGYVHQIDRRRCRFVKVTITNNSEGNHYGGHIVELEVFGMQARPSLDRGVRAVCRLRRDTTLQKGRSLSQSAVMGVVPPGQLRRGFLHYVERERVAPYRPFLHYNSWYDIAWGQREKMNSDECVEVIDSYGAELTTKRGVQLDSFVFDDGWDDPKTLWQILEKNFPEGFTPLQRAAVRYGSNIGIWLSPWGGYGQAKADRLAYGKTQGFETGKAGFSLTGPKYFDRFRQSCVGFVEKYNVNFFKFDGTDASLLNETEALLRLCEQLYSLNDKMYISITTGTWASPFWLLGADSVWRGGGDMGFYGPGGKREQWLTYRDKLTFQNMVKGGPLYPLNSFMNQGIAHAIWGTANLPVNAEEFAHEVHSFFAIGTSLQELYISPSRMTGQMWDILAEGAKWSRNNSDVLVDTHWVGGDPAEGQIYGWAAWSKRKGILSLRNPHDKSAKITIDISKVFELPIGAARKYSLKSPWKKDAGRATIVLSAGKEHTYELKPFEVMVFDAMPL